MQKHNTIAIVTISLLLPYNVFLFAITVTVTQIKQGRGKDREQLKVLVVHAFGLTHVHTYQATNNL